MAHIYLYFHICPYDLIKCYQLFPQVQPRHHLSVEGLATFPQKLLHASSGFGAPEGFVEEHQVLLQGLGSLGFRPGYASCLFNLGKDFLEI